LKIRENGLGHIDAKGTRRHGAPGKRADLLASACHAGRERKAPQKESGRIRPQRIPPDALFLPTTPVVLLP
jgi:hypothetical protein